MGRSGGGPPRWPPEDLSDLEGLPPSPIGYTLRWALIGLAAMLAFFLANFVRTTYTDWLWFENLHYPQVFTTILWYKVGLFLIGALAFLALASVNVLAANLILRRLGLPSAIPQLSAYGRILTTVVLGIAVVLALAFGSAASAHWETLLKFLKGTLFGQTDPIFGRDISLYVFNLPFYAFLRGWLLGMITVLLFMVTGLYALQFALRGQRFTLPRPVKVHLALLATLFVLVLGAGYWLDIYRLLLSPSSIIFGAGYTDVNTRLLGLRILLGTSLLWALLTLANIFTRDYRPAIAGAALWLLVLITMVNLYPGIVQRFQVQPNELNLELPYIQNNITYTRQAFGLSNIAERLYPAEQTVTREEVGNNPDTIDNIRLWDYRPLKDAYSQQQVIRRYYEFNDVDVDRYTLDGEYRQFLLAARELDIKLLGDTAQSWINQRLQYTHGYGVAMSPVTEFTSEGRPTYMVQDIPPAGKLKVTIPQIYFGELTNHYVLVNTKTSEFDYPTAEDVPVYTRYQGTGGVQLSSYLRKVLYAWEFGDVNILISDQILSESRLQYRRNIQERLRTLAPFLRLDRDPYLVIANEKLYWMTDAYTITDSYPYAEPYRKSFNYLRNSVKIVVDAYTGDVDFYVSDPSDPLIQTYQKIFHSMFKPMDSMPPYLKSHIRYPIDFFMIQTEMLLTYHMQDPRVFYNKEDLWSIPNELYYGTSQPMEPYYVIMRLPEESKEEFLLMMPFTPANKNNLVAWLGARADQPYYGKLLNYKFPKDKQIDGPSQVEARISNNDVIAQQITLWNQQGSQVIRGNLLVIPIGQSLLYVEPLYLQAQALAIPELKRVILVTGNKVVMEDSLSKSLASLLGTPAPSVVSPPQPQPGSGGAPSNAQAQLKALQQALIDLQGTLKKMEESLKKLQEAIAP